jgi:SAM-dependent methyltransferase
MKLNLGCDLDYRKDWINLDNYEGRADVVHDLNIFPYPFEDNVFEYIYASHVVEHLEDVPRVLKELWRISKEGGVIEIKVPYYNNYNAFRDVTHIRYFTWDSFSPMALGKSREKGHEIGYMGKLFSYIERGLVWATSTKPIVKPIANFMNWIVNISPSFLEKRIPYIITCESLHVKLRVDKKGVSKTSAEQKSLTDQRIASLLKKSSEKYPGKVMNVEKWKKKRKKVLGEKGKNWTK